MQGIQDGCETCGCESCDIFSDNFNRADDTDLGSDWSEVSGSWAITSNTLRTSSTSAVCVHDNGTSSSAMSVSCEVQGASGDYLRVIAAYQDASNYWFAEVKIGASGTGRFDLYQRSGGTNTLKSGGTGSIAASTWHTVTVCIMFGENGSTDTVTAQLNSTLAFQRFAYHTETVNDGCGVGTGSTAGSVQFDNFAVTKTDGSCPKCVLDCTTCGGSGAAPLAFDVTLPVMERVGSAGCPDCTIFSNQTYRIYQCAPCSWLGVAGTCNGVTYNILLTNTTAVGVAYLVFFPDIGEAANIAVCAGGGTEFQDDLDYYTAWQHNIATDLDCLDTDSDWTGGSQAFTQSGRCRRQSGGGTPTTTPVL